VASAPIAHASTGASVTPSTHNDVSPPLRLIPPAVQDTNKREGPQHRHSGKQLPSTGTTAASAVVATRTPSLNTSFEGVGQGFSGPQGSFTVNSAPPDPNGAVGPNHFVEVVNSSFAVFNKSGTPVYGPVATNTLWSGFGGLCQQDNDGDATVKYDQFADRWVIQQLAITGVTTNFYICVAVSTTSDPTGSYYRYQFPFANFPDYPKLSVWPDGYYLSINQFNSSGTTYLGPWVGAMDRGSMLSGAPATIQSFTLSTSYSSLLASDVDGATPPPTGSPAYFLSLDISSLDFWRLHVDWSNASNAWLGTSSTNSAPTQLAVTSYSTACGGVSCIPQAGTRTALDALDDRLMYRVSYRNFGDHEALLANHSVNAGGHAGVRWYELRGPGSTPSIYQSGTYAPDSNYRWMGSIAMDHAGDIGLGFSVSSGSINPQIHYTGRVPTDPLGMMQGDQTIINGTGSQNNRLHRWGDYTSMAVDPSDDCTFWYTNEYLSNYGSFNWQTRVGTFKFPNCSATPSDFGITATNASAPQGGSGTSTVSTTVLAGSAQNVQLSVTGGLPSGTTANFSPNPVLAGQSSTLTFTPAATTTPGPYTVTVGGTETGSNATHSASLTLTVTGSDFSISAIPSSLSIGQGSSGTSTIGTAVTTGAAQNVSLSASQPVSGISTSFNPTSVNAGGSSTMTVSVGGTVPVGAYTVTVTGAGATGVSHSTNVAVTVTAPPPSDFSISATNASAAQGGSGNSTIATAVTSGSAQTVSLSIGALPNGVSASFNPASVTAGNSSTLTLSAVFSATPGTYTVTVTGTSASATHSTNLTLTVTSSDFTISANPASIAVAQGSSGKSTINTATSSGVAQTVNLSSAPPSGITAVLNPTSVSSGGSSTLTVSVASSMTIGTYTIAVTGTGQNATHSANVTVNVVTPNPVVNGGFETGDLSGWTNATPSHPATVVGSGVAAPHSGSYSAQLGTTTPYNGNSTITQTVTIPSGSSRLTFWYQPHCPDTLTYDQIQMQIQNTSGSVLATVLNVCSNTGTWTSVSYDTSAYAGTSVVLWFNDHDDGYAGDATYFFLDDVAINPYTPAPNVVQNPGFETGTFSGWTVATPGHAPVIVSSPAHSGLYAAQLGTTTAYNGNSTLTQTITVPTGSPTLSFWYQPHCPDTLTYDQIQMQIQNTSGTVLATVLNVCSNTGAWTQVSFDMTPYAGQTVVLWFNDHDDGYAGDATYFYLDDVSVS
jgi:hypothetical protein